MVVDTPTCIPFARSESVAPPRILVRFLRELSEGVNHAAILKLVKPLPKDKSLLYWYKKSTVLNIISNIQNGTHLAPHHFFLNIDIDNAGTVIDI